ncbi:MAG: GNAT family N-acetyltransferase [Clostridia bacterium]|nr:GNAT family N-acetyltransferase [Clostridia bacterium]
MKISTVKMKHKQQVKDLWNYCFYDADPYLSWFFDNVFKPENTVAAIENDKILSAMQLLDFDVVIRGKTYPCTYIAGVSTQPEFRGKGLATKVMEYAEETIKSRGREFALLTPSVDNFYEKFGFTSCYERLEYSYCPTDFKPDKSGCTSQKAGLSDASDMAEVYDGFSGFFDGYVKRSQKDFADIIEQYSLESGGAYIFYDENDKPVSYIVYDLSDRTIFADEIAYTCSQGLDAALEFIFLHSSQADRCVIFAPSHSLLNSTLYSRQIEIKYIPTVMVKSLAHEIEDVRLFVGQTDSDDLPLQKNYIRIF